MSLHRKFKNIFQKTLAGSVVTTKDAVIPATVGVVIGCGMGAAKMPFKSGILLQANL